MTAHPVRLQLGLGLVLALASCRCPSSVTQQPPLEALRIGDAVAFPDTFLGFVSRRTVSVTNPGRSARDVRLSTSSSFSSAASATVSGGETLELEVTFSPTQAGLATGLLELVDDEAGTTSTVSLSGLGLEVPACAAPGPCVTSRFDVDAKGCVEAALADGTSCASPLACFTTASCVSGECRGAAVTCDDGNPCTLDVCSELGCGQVDATPFCPTSVNPCLVPTCAVDAGCGFVEAADGTACGERTCTTALICLSGACVSRTPPRNQSCTELLVGVPAGNGTNDGRGADVRFGSIRSLAAQGDDLLIVDGTRLRRVTGGGLVSSVAGVANQPGLVDGYGQSVRLGASAELAPSTRPGTFFLGDATTVRLASLQGSVGTLAGSPDAGGRVDGVGALARLRVSSPMTLAGSRARFLQHERVTSFSTHVFLRDVSLSGEVRTLADLDLATFAGFDPMLRWSLSGRVVDAVDRLEVLLFATSLGGSVTSRQWTVAIAPDGGVSARQTQVIDVAWERDGHGVLIDSCSATFVSDAGRTYRARDACGPVGFDGDGGLWSSTGTALEHLSSTERRLVAGPTPEQRLVDGASDAGRLSWPRALSPPYAEGVYFIDSTRDVMRVRRFAAGRVETVDAGSLWDVRSLAALGSTLWVMDANGVATLVDRQTAGRTGRVVVPSAAGLALVASNGVELRALNGSTLSTVLPDGGAVVAASFPRARLLAAGPNGTWVVLGAVDPMTSERLLQVDPAGVVTVLAGAPGVVEERDGPAGQAGLGAVGALAVAADGTVYWSSPATNRIRQLRNGQVSTVIELSDTVHGLSVSPDGTLLVAVDAALLRVVP